MIALWFTSRLWNIKCFKSETYLGSVSQSLGSMDSTLNDAVFCQCIKYDFDKSSHQIYDLPFESLIVTVN